MSGPGPIRAAGAVLWRPAAAGPLIALVHRPRYDDWSLPKGKLDAGEHPLEAAVREVREESGFTATVGRRLPSTAYRSTAGPKAVDYWAMLADDGRFTPGNEVDDLAWLPSGDALPRLSYSHDRDVVEDFRRLTADTVVLLVRHGEAGERGSWPQADELRPLDPVGVRQALRLAAVLVLFGPRRIVCADRVRCTQTLDQWDIPILCTVIAAPTVVAALVLDKSGSMDWDAGGGRTRIQVLHDSAPPRGS